MIAGESRYQFIRISRELHRYAQEAVTPVCSNYDLTLQQMYVLKELQLCSGQSISALSDRVGILHANFPSVCRKLESKGFIERERSETDRRSSLLRLTPAGRDIITKMDDEITLSFDVRFDSEVREALEKINEGLASLEKIVKKKSLVK